MTRFITPLCLVVALLIAANAGAQVGKSVTIADANTIAETDVAKLPHMNAAIAKALVAKRPFLSMTTLDMFLQSQGLNRMLLNELYGRLFLHINLKSASDAEIQLSPNLGPRMLREFKEYRPYKNIEQFRKEIGKYVGPKEVARLERYVTL